MSKIIVLEGACDGIGKSTQLELLTQKLNKNNVPFISHHFPSYNTFQGKGVEEFLKGNFGEINNISPYFINNLYAFDRSITWYTKLKKEYDSGKSIIFDRYTTSSLIYQSALVEDIEERKRFIDYVIDFEYNKLGIKSPDKVIFLYTSFEVASKQMKSRLDNEGINNDIFERDLELMKKIYANAMFIADYLSWTLIKCDKDNKTRDKEDISKEIYSKLELD